MGCGETDELIELSIKNAPDPFVELNEEIDAGQFTVNLKINGKEQNDLPITDPLFEVTGLVNGKLDTSSPGKKTITVAYGAQTVAFEYIVANFLVRTYDELENAVSQEGEFVVLMNDISVNSSGTGISIPKDSVKTLELNGHVLSFMPDLSGTTELIKNEGVLTIQDSSDEKNDGSGTGVITNKALNPDDKWSDEDPEHPFPFYANNTITNKGQLTIESGLIENLTSSGAAYAIDNNSNTSDAVVSVKGGKIVSPRNFAIRMFANSTKHKNVVNVSGGVIEGIRAIWLQLPGASGEEKLAEMKISGGTLRSIDEEYNLAIYSYTFGDSFGKTKITITGGIFEGDVAFTGGSRKTPTETVVVSGGYFRGRYGVYSYGLMEPFITGGTFASNPSDYVDSKTHQVNVKDGEYVVNAK